MTSECSDVIAQLPISQLRDRFNGSQTVVSCWFWQWVASTDYVGAGRLRE